MAAALFPARGVPSTHITGNAAICALGNSATLASDETATAVLTGYAHAAGHPHYGDAARSFEVGRAPSDPKLLGVSTNGRPKLSDQIRLIITRAVSGF